MGRTGGGGGISEADADARYLEELQDLADVDSQAGSRSNLGLGDSSVLDVGTGAGDVAAGDRPAAAQAAAEATASSDATAKANAAQAASDPAGSAAAAQAASDPAGSAAAAQAASDPSGSAAAAQAASDPAGSAAAAQAASLPLHGTADDTTDVAGTLAATVRDGAADGATALQAGDASLEVAADVGAAKIAVEDGAGGMTGAANTLHSQGTDQGVDTGGANATTAAQLKSAVTNSHANTNDPTADEKAALVGTGTPAAGDKYVNDSDARNTDARTPVAHAIDGAGHTGEGDSVTRSVGVGAGDVAAGNAVPTHAALTTGTHGTQLDKADTAVQPSTAPVLAVTNMSGSAAGLDSNATTHAGLTTTAHGGILVAPVAPYNPDQGTIILDGGVAKQGIADPCTSVAVLPLWDETGTIVATGTEYDMQHLSGGTAPILKTPIAPRAISVRTYITVDDVASVYGEIYITDTAKAKFVGIYLRKNVATWELTIVENGNSNNNSGGGITNAMWIGFTFDPTTGYIRAGYSLNAANNDPGPIENGEDWVLHSQEYTTPRADIPQSPYIYIITENGAGGGTHSAEFENIEALYM